MARRFKVRDAFVADGEIAGGDASLSFEAGGTFVCMRLSTELCGEGVAYLVEGFDALSFLGFSAFGLRTSLLDFFWLFAMIFTFVERARAQFVFARLVQGTDGRFRTYKHASTPI